MESSTSAQTTFALLLQQDTEMVLLLTDPVQVSFFSLKFFLLLQKQIVLHFAMNAMNVICSSHH